MKAQDIVYLIAQLVMITGTQEIEIVFRGGSRLSQIGFEPPAEPEDRGGDPLVIEVDPDP